MRQSSKRDKVHFRFMRGRRRNFFQSWRLRKRKAVEAFLLHFQEKVCMCEGKGGLALLKKYCII